MDSANNSFSIFSQIYSNSNSHDFNRIKQKEDENARNSVEFITQQNEFFALILRLFAKKNEGGDLSKDLSLAANISFSSLEDALTLAKNPAGQSPLHYAFQQQDFTLAHQLMSFGAKAGPVEKAVFEVALDSKAARDYGFTTKHLKENTLHPVKNYGLVLGIELTSKDGTFSQFGHIAPTYQIMTNAVNNHAKNSSSASFKEIAQAYQFSNNAAAFSFSTSQRNPAAGQDIAARLQEGKITTIPASFSGHAIGLSVVPDGPGSKTGYLVVTNRGLNKNPNEAGTQIYRISDLSKIDKELVNTLMNGHSQGVSHTKIMDRINKITEGRPPVHTIAQKDQKYDNCSIANTRANTHGILLCQKAKEKGGFDKLGAEDFAAVKKEYTHST